VGSQHKGSGKAHGDLQDQALQRNRKRRASSKEIRQADVDHDLGRSGVAWTPAGGSADTGKLAVPHQSPAAVLSTGFRRARSSAGKGEIIEIEERHDAGIRPPLSMRDMRSGHDPEKGCRQAKAVLLDPLPANRENDPEVR
jgi:hypothetical protein